MNKDALINIRVNQYVKDEFQKIVEREGFTMSEVIQASMKDIIVRNNIPISTRTKIERKANPVITIPFIKKCLENAMISTSNKSIKKITLFGSYANGTENAKSDIDLYIEADESISLIDLSAIQDELEINLKRKVDLVTGSDNTYFINNIQREGIQLYERRS